MVIKLEIRDGVLVGVRESDKRVIEYGLMPVRRVKVDTMAGKPRWKDNSFLNEDQVADEIFTRRMHIA